ncbi:hypothetical protein [Rhodopirellula sp. MGV]|uniref:hypothetical protein n=1 Tax=Rhodopirellula sp. MGV TaxID=2023130 RepID=UPI0018EA1167|nr:hypothetical protein [Rhodopirellula sp. MGV]
MGGMGGGMGGGMFVVPDDVQLSDKKATDEPEQPATATPAQLTQSQFDAIEPIKLEVKDGQTRSEAWAEYFAGLDLQTAEDVTLLDQRIRRTVSRFSSKAAAADQAGDREAALEWFTQSRDLISEAILAGQIQPWMYHAYAIALTATGAPNVEVERALLSAVDFAETPSDVLNVASRLEAIGSYAASLRLCQRVADLEPNRREPYVMGMRLAESLDDHDAIVWACEGVLSQAWPVEFSDIVDKAKLLARSTYAGLIEEGQTEKAAKFGEALKLASAHDVVIRVSWTGDADIDLAVEEPSGTVCSMENRSSAGGGTLLGDSYPGQGESKSGTISETYVCPSGFSGQYRLMVRKIWGEVSTGQATVEIVTDAGRPSQNFIRQEIPLTEKDAMLVFEVKDGKRKEQLGEAQLADLRDVQRDLNANMLGQFANPGNNAGQALSELYYDIQRMTGGVSGAGNNPFWRRAPAVGFQPQITQLPEGAGMTGLAIISADRRYVRISPAPFFSQVGDVTTFNFVSGTSGTGTGGGAAGGGNAAGGLGGGAAGGFGN